MDLTCQTLLDALTEAHAAIERLANRSFIVFPTDKETLICGYSTVGNLRKCRALSDKLAAIINAHAAE